MKSGIFVLSKRSGKYNIPEELKARSYTCENTTSDQSNEQLMFVEQN